MSFGCDDGKSSAHPLFLGSWKSDTFVMKNKSYYFQVDFDSVHSIVNVKRFRITSSGVSCKDSFEAIYKKKKNTIKCHDRGRIYKFEYVNPEKIIIHYNNRKINMTKL